MNVQKSNNCADCQSEQKIKDAFFNSVLREAINHLVNESAAPRADSSRIALMLEALSDLQTSAPEFRASFLGDSDRQTDTDKDRKEFANASIGITCNLFSAATNEGCAAEVWKAWTEGELLEGCGSLGKVIKTNTDGSLKVHGPDISEHKAVGPSIPSSLNAALDLSPDDLRAALYSRIQMPEER